MRLELPGINLTGTSPRLLRFLLLSSRAKKGTEPSPSEQKQEELVPNCWLAARGAGGLGQSLPGCTRAAGISDGEKKEDTKHDLDLVCFPEGPPGQPLNDIHPSKPTLASTPCIFHFRCLPAPLQGH